MNTTAIRQAIKLYKHPLEMSGLAAVHASLPSGITDLLRLCASDKRLEIFSEERNIDSDMLYNVLTHFIENVLFKEGCSSYKILGVDQSHQNSTDNIVNDNLIKDSLINNSAEKLRLHYQLLMNIYHPDRNRSSSSAFYASKISRAYDVLKRDKANAGISSPTSSTTTVKDSYYYEPPKSYYQATNKAQQQINQTQNTFFALAGVAFLTLITAAIYLNQPDSSRLIVRNQTPVPETISLATAQTLAAGEHTNFQNASINNHKISGKIMQTLLHKLEKAYEQGNVEQITPILANAPELKQQSTEELSDKLETLFKITKDRKMVLYDFSWVNIAGNIQGQGQFLSRYLLEGDDQWQTRTGPATVSAKIDGDNMIHITTLDMNDQAIQQ